MFIITWYYSRIWWFNKDPEQYMQCKKPNKSTCIYKLNIT